MKTYETYLDRYYNGNEDIADIMEHFYDGEFLDGMDEEDESMLSSYEGDWDSVSLHSNSKFWRR